jgi:hypothetical protein
VALATHLWPHAADRVGDLISRLAHPVALAFGALLVTLSLAALSDPSGWPGRKLTGKTRGRDEILPWAAGGAIFGLGYVAFGLHWISVVVLGVPVVAASLAWSILDRVSRR